MSDKAPRRRAAAEPDDLDAKIRRAKTELEQMVDLNPQGMMLVSRDGTIERVNRALIDLLGRRKFTGVLGKSIEELLPSRDADFWPKLLKGKSGYRNGEAQVRIPRRGRRPLHATVVDAPRGGLHAVIVRDVTEEKEQAVAQEKGHKLEAVHALMGALMHNINQPLTVIMMRARLLLLSVEEGRTETADFRKGLQDIMQLVTKIADILERARRAREFSTERYIQGQEFEDLEILDLGGDE
jgi:PAS domain S-box-containing protein